MFRFHKQRPPVNLALQGGGAHGAFTWGVLDHLLEDGRLEFEGISGTSAGAMNAVVMVHGLATGGRDGARAALAKFWTAVAHGSPFDVATTSDGNAVTLNPMARLMLQWTHYFSPSQFNPYDINKLRDIVTAQVDFERLRFASPVKLYVAATNANSGKLKLFRRDEICADAVLASACLPTMFRAVEIDGEPYWDGGYAANPAVFPLFYDCRARDIVLVLLTPLKHRETPHGVQEIQERILELAFNATFLREMRMFAHLRDYVSRSGWPMGRFERRVRAMRFHLVEAEELMQELAAETRLAARLGFFEMLRDRGRNAAKAWLDGHAADVGKRSSVDLSALFY
jgi:NTE family protein